MLALLMCLLFQIIDEWLSGLGSGGSGSGGSGSGGSGSESDLGSGQVLWSGPITFSGPKRQNFPPAFLT